MKAGFQDWLTEKLPLGKGVEILRADDSGLFALSKPEGVRSHPNRAGSIDPKALLRLPYNDVEEAYLMPTEADAESGIKKAEFTRVYLLNRLDGPTSGVILLAPQSDVAERVRAAFRSHTVKKVYHAICFGVPSPRQGVWEDRLEKQRADGGVRSVAGKGLLARTAYRVVSTENFADKLLSLIELEPMTGRTHQLRIQCQLHGCPIVGDQTYGDFSLNRLLLNGEEAWARRLYLHCSATAVAIDRNGRSETTFRAESPHPFRFAAGANAVAKNAVLQNRRFRAPATKVVKRKR